MKYIDIKSVIIGVLLTTTIFLGVAATGTTDKWDGKQKSPALTTSGNIVMGVLMGDDADDGVEGVTVLKRNRF